MARSDYARVAEAIEFIVDNQREQPSLDDVASRMGLSAARAQKLFSRWAGVSPKRFLQALTAERAKDALARSSSVLEASLDAGLSGPGRLHDLLVSTDGLSPGQIGARAAGVVIEHGTIETRFGRAVVAKTPQGLCALRFLEGDTRTHEIETIGEIQREWPDATFVTAKDGLASVARAIESASGIPLHLRGTNLQLHVWRALLAIPEGSLVSYQRLAATVGRPDAVRAVASAVAKNPVGMIVPCHRVLRATGALGGYRWGLSRKRAMIAAELAASDSAHGR
ncbi:MAG: methylated-DNA--[protein]-cysteine S-methyltransferase [Myxococcales bacterium]|nr:methylated-DNA--[protein]-cysteine S-methyltransferase [Myxococcales bacterium]